MKTQALVLSSLLLAVSGGAFAQTPRAGEGPLFQNQPVAASTLSRDAVRADIALNPPAAGAQNASAVVTPQAIAKSRAEVRAETRDAIAHGVKVKAGEQS